MSAISHQTIALRLGVSCSTVSRSLANHPAISAETRERVQKMADELGYRPSSGRVLRRKGTDQTFRVGVLVGIPDFSVELTTFPQVLEGIRKRSRTERVKVDVSYQPPGDFLTKAGQRELFRNIRQCDWRGVILIYPYPESAIAGILRKVSTVAALENYRHPGIDIVDMDDAAGVLAVVEAMHAAGHRRIGFLSWEYQVTGHWVARRFSGYMEALYLHGLEFNPDWVINVHKNSPRLSPTGVADAVARGIRENGITAWVCAADHQAYHLIPALQARGLRVGADYSVAGFDGLPPPAGLPKLSTVAVPYEQIGATALTRLLGRIGNPAAPRRKMFVEAEFVPGETIVPCATSANRQNAVRADADSLAARV